MARLLVGAGTIVAEELVLCEVLAGVSDPVDVESLDGFERSVYV